MKTVLALVAAVAACSKSRDAGDVPCDSKAVNALFAELHMANGLEMDLQDPDVRARIAAMAKAVDGKKYAFTGCKPAEQGEDFLVFIASDGSRDHELWCHMKGGEAGVDAFRHAAMALGIEKAKLDVRGVVASDHHPYVPRFALRECEIDVHD
jgi:hypothetical protein